MNKLLFLPPSVLPSWIFDHRIVIKSSFPDFHLSGQVDSQGRTPSLLSFFSIRPSMCPWGGVSSETTLSGTRKTPSWDV